MKQLALPYSLSVLCLCLVLLILPSGVQDWLFAENGLIEGLGMLAWVALAGLLLAVPRLRYLWPWAFVCLALAERELDIPVETPRLIEAMLLLGGLVALAHLILVDAANLRKAFANRAIWLLGLAMAFISLAVAQVFEELAHGSLAKTAFVFEEVLETSAPLLLIFVIAQEVARRGARPSSGWWTPN